MTKIFIATPAHGETFYAPYVQSVIGLQRLIDNKGWQSIFATVSYYDVSESRNYLLTRWHDKTDATHLLFVDADMGFDPKVVEEMVAFDKPVVGVIYPKRQVDLTKIAKLASEGMPPAQAIARGHEHIYRKLRGRAPRTVNGFLEVEACGTGLMLIRRDCIEGMLEKLPALGQSASEAPSPFDATLKRVIRAFDILQVDGERLSDDYSFCYRWRQCGGDIWANSRSIITHVGLQRFQATLSDARHAPRVVVGKHLLKAKTGLQPKVSISTDTHRDARTADVLSDPASVLTNARPATAGEVTLAFLKGQIDSPIWGRYYKEFLHIHNLSRSSLIDQADLSDSLQTEMRHRMMVAASGQLLKNFPEDVKWRHGFLAPAQFKRLRHPNCAPWVSFTQGSLLVRDTLQIIKNKRTDDASDPNGIRAQILAIIARVNSGAQFPELIAVEGDGGDLILIEGNTRATAYMAAGIKHAIGAFVGSSKKIREWLLY